ncbi:MAG: flagellar basal body-associated FliL family protein, partial [Aeromonas sp.]|nr:flagellar basal body-associated FliL family protein [Aeromonas sp.]
MKIFKILLLLLLSCGSLHVQASSEEEPSAEGADAAAKPGFSYHALDPDIITNYLSDGKTLGYIRITVELMAENESDLKLLEQHDPLIRDAIIRLMGSKTAEQVKSLV